MINQPEPKRPASKSWIVYGLILIAIFGATLALRVVPMYEAVFGSDIIRLQGVDGIYHLRLVENLLQHFPFRIAFDPYTYFPNGQSVYFAPLFDLLAGFCAWVIGLGSPDQHTIETIAAFFPAVLGALVVVPVYFIGKMIMNRAAGLIGAVLVGVFPGTLLFRSRLGFFDHHIAEIFFSTLTIMFLLLALKNIKAHPISFENIRGRQWKSLVKPLLWTALCGISLGSYLLVWVGGLLFVFLIFCWILVMFIIEHLRKQSTDYLSLVGVPIFTIALLIVIPFLGQIAYSDLYVASLLVSLAGSLILGIFSRFLVSKNISKIYFPISLAGVAVIGIIVLFIFFPTLADAIMSKFQVFTPNESGMTVSEMRPMFINNGKFTLASPWAEFNTSLIAAPIAFILLCISCIRKFESWKMLMVVWSVLVFAASVGQIRFSAYLAVAIAILAAYFYAEICSFIYRLFIRVKNRLPPMTVRSNLKQAHKKHVKVSESSTPEFAHSAPSVAFWKKATVVSMCVILVFFAAIFPNISPALKNAKSNAGINDEWRESLLWMKNNTPEPFLDENFYYALYEKPSGDIYDYPASAYGVLAWWDYGHMITEIAHRIPNANPFQFGAASAAQYFITQQESAANQQLDALGTRYIMIDFDIAIPYAVSNNNISGKKFYAMPTWANKDPSEFCEIYYQAKNNQMHPVPLYYPEYYYCMVTRLYNFHGAAVVPSKSTTVISFTEQSGIKVLQSSQVFATYEEALAFLEKQTSNNFRIVGTSPFNSPVPLTKLEHYKQVHNSPSGVTYAEQRTNSAYIEIFEYKP